MKKEKTLEQLEIARQIVSSDTPFEYNAYGIWRNPRIGLNALRYFANGYEIRIKPQPDKFAELKKAHAEGKKIQFKCGDEPWDDIEDPSWSDRYKYRIKPEPVKVPLGPEDVTPGSIIRLSSQKSYAWHTVTSLASSHIFTELSGKISFEALKINYEINRSIPLTGKWDPSAWEPCYKEVEQ